MKKSDKNLYFNLQYPVKENTDSYKLSRFINERNETLEMQICNNQT